MNGFYICLLCGLLLLSMAAAVEVSFFLCMLSF